MKKLLLFSLVLLNSSAFGMFCDPEGCPYDSIPSSFNSSNQEIHFFVNNLQKNGALLINKIDFFENNPQIADKVVAGGIQKKLELITTMRPHEALLPFLNLMAFLEMPLSLAASTISLLAEEKKNHPERNYSDEALADIHILFRNDNSVLTGTPDDSYDDYMKDLPSN